MDKQPTPVETPEEFEQRRSMSESLYERDRAFLKALDEGRRGKDVQWTGPYE